MQIVSFGLPNLSTLFPLLPLTIYCILPTNSMNGLVWQNSPLSKDLVREEYNHIKRSLKKCSGSSQTTASAATTFRVTMVPYTKCSLITIKISSLLAKMAFSNRNVNVPLYTAFFSCRKGYYYYYRFVGGARKWGSYFFLKSSTPPMPYMTSLRLEFPIRIIE